MRIIAGTYRGRTIKAPDGRDTRPTTDRVRESLMSAISSALGGFEGLHVYDVFAGSGALGIECLSRGAAFAVFTEQEPRTAALIRQNLESLDVPAATYRVIRGDVLKHPAVCGGAYDLVMLDPPYAYAAASMKQLLDQLESMGGLGDEVLITYEHAKGSDISALWDGGAVQLESLGTKIYGDIVIEFIGKARN